MCSLQDILDCSVQPRLRWLRNWLHVQSLQLPKSQLFAQPHWNLGKLHCFGMQVPNFHPPVPVNWPDGLHGLSRGSWTFSREFIQLHWFTSSHPFGQGSLKAVKGDKAEPVAPNTCQGWGRTTSAAGAGNGNWGLRNALMEPCLPECWVPGGLSYTSNPSKWESGEMARKFGQSIKITSPQQLRLELSHEYNNLEYTSFKK